MPLQHTVTLLTMKQGCCALLLSDTDGPLSGPSDTCVPCLTVAKALPLPL